MKVPKAIRDVPRPDGTIVYAYGDPPKYNVKERTYGVDENGKRYQKDGNTVGSIVNGRYVPLLPRMDYCDVDILSWGPSKLVTDLSGDLLDDLLAVYNRDEAMQIYVLAVLRTVDSGIKDYEADEAYRLDYLSHSMPGVALSKDTVGKLLFNLGKTCSKITEYMNRRAGRVPATHLVAVDGSLKSYESQDNPLSDFSRKARLKGSRDISVMYAYDVDSMEPICSQVNPGNVTDVAAFRGFMETNGLRKGVIVTDKGFSYDNARSVFTDNPDLRFIIPIRRDMKIIDEYRILCSDGSLQNRSGISCRKERMHDGRFIYGFRDSERASAEERSWLDRRKDFDPAELTEFRREAGSIVFVSNLDTTCEIVYAAYEERWEIEILFRFYKHILEFDETRVESVQSVIGTEFVNHLSVVMTSRLRKRFITLKELQRRSFRSCMRLLSKGMMVRTDGNGEWRLGKLTKSETDIFIGLGLINPPDQPVKRPGRPKGSKNKKK